MMGLEYCGIYSVLLFVVVVVVAVVVLATAAAWKAVTIVLVQYKTNILDSTFSWKRLRTWMNARCVCFRAVAICAVA